MIASPSGAMTARMIALRSRIRSRRSLPAMMKAARIGRQSRRARPVRCRKTASRSGSTISTLVTPAPAAATASRMRGRMRRASTTIRLSPPSWTLALLDALDRPHRVGGGRQLAARRELDAIALADHGRELAARALGDDPPLVDDPDAIAEALRLLHVVGRVEDGHALPAELLDARQDRVAALRVDADRRLVEDEQPRLVEQPDADVQPPLHAAGELVGTLAGPLVEADDLEHLADAPLQRVTAHAVQLAEEAQVLGRGQLRVDRELLRDVPDRLLRLRRADVDRASGDVHLATVTLQEAADHRDRGRLAGTVRPEQAVGLGWTDAEPDAVDGGAIAVPLAEPVAGEDALGRHRPDGIAGRIRCFAARSTNRLNIGWTTRCIDQPLESAPMDGRRITMLGTGLIGDFYTGCAPRAAQP